MWESCSHTSPHQEDTCYHLKMTSTNRAMFCMAQRRTHSPHTVLQHCSHGTPVGTTVARCWYTRRTLQTGRRYTVHFLFDTGRHHRASVSARRWVQRLERELDLLLGTQLGSPLGQVLARQLARKWLQLLWQWWFRWLWRWLLVWCSHIAEFRSDTHSRR